MKEMKKISIITLCLLLILPSFLSFAASENGEDDEVEFTDNAEGSLASKDEVVYATLNANGKSKELYIVNSLEVEEAGKVVDYGDYTSVKNLTDLSEIQQSGNQIEVTAEEGRFYYQGNMNTELLPWEFDIRYYLDGSEVSPEELAGAEGNLEITIHSEENAAVDPVFFENYLLQISLAVDAESTTNIETEEGMLANAGKNIQITFTVMPEEEGEVSVSADVVDFELEGIDITAIPSTMNIDAPDTDNLTGEMRTLADAIAEINDGVVELRNGASELNEGATALSSGSNEYLNGITALDNGSDELVAGSAEIRDALAMMSDALEGMDDIDLSDLEIVIDGLSELADGIREISGALSQLRDGFREAYQALEEAINNIPYHEVTEEEIAELYQSGANPETVDKLVETYVAAQTVKGTFEHTKEAFLAVDQTLAAIIETLNGMADNVDLVVDEFSKVIEDFDPSNGLGELVEGIQELSANYNTFHRGLVEYTNGLGQLASSYQKINQGIGELSNGTAEFENGIGSLQEGTAELTDATSDIPEQMTEEIDQMISEYDKSDFDAVSFVSEQNENVNSVQFVLTTESIEVEETDEGAEEDEEEKSLWQRFIDLFN